MRSGRTDLVDNDILPKVNSHCLFIAGDREKMAIKIAKGTMKKLRNVQNKELRIIKGASHLMQEEGTIEKLADISSRWLSTFLHPSTKSNIYND